MSNTHRTNKSSGRETIMDNSRAIKVNEEENKTILLLLLSELQ